VLYSGDEPSSGGDSSDDERRRRKPKRRDNSGEGRVPMGTIQVGSTVAMSPRIQTVENRLAKHADMSAGKHPRAMKTHQIMKSCGDCALQGAIVPVIIRIYHPTGKNFVEKVHTG
jgi:hypothetical protein